MMFNGIMWGMSLVIYIYVPGLGNFWLFPKSKITTDCVGFAQDAAAWVTDQLKTTDTVELVFWTNCCETDFEDGAIQWMTFDNWWQ